jgi:Family of unknown function (DUF6263)
MKKIYIPLVCLLITGAAFAQSSKIKLSNGQKIIIETTSDVQASLAMGMELNSNSVLVNALEVRNSTEKGYTISNTLTKLKLNMNMMGQPNNYDSENKEGNNAEIAKIFDSKLNSPVDVVIDNTTGAALPGKKKVKKDDAEEANPTDDILAMFSDNSDDAIVSGAFEVIPQGKKTGDSWADTAVTKEMKTISIYTLKSVTGNEAVILSDVISNAVNKLNLQEMEFEIKSETKTKGEIIADINTGLVSKRTTVADITGSIQMMGQDMPITAKTTTTNIYK